MFGRILDKENAHWMFWSLSNEKQFITVINLDRETTH